MYVALIFRDWTNAFELGNGMEVKPDMTSVGFLEVFKTKAAARKVYGKHVELVEIRTNTGGPMKPAHDTCEIVDELDRLCNIKEGAE